MKIALISCSNGYGHIRRLLVLSVALQEKGVTPVLFSPLYSAKEVAKKERIQLPIVIDFNTNTKQKDWINGTATEWVNKIPDLSGYEIVVSDNLIEVLLIRPDAYILGSFFWHESLINFPKDLKNRAAALLDIYKPTIISSRIFTSDYIRKYSNVFEVGLFSTSGDFYKYKYKDKKDALIACGKGGNVREQAKNFVKKLASKENNLFGNVWVEPEILPDYYPLWMVPATFSYKMYKSVIVSIIRPGVGTITNSILSGARVFPFYESNNKEMKLNASILKFYEVGENTNLISEAWSRANMFAFNHNSRLSHDSSIHKLDISGSQQAAEIILKDILK